MFRRRTTAGDDRPDDALERRVVELLDLADAAGFREQRQEQARWSGEAMEVCRVLVARHPGDRRHLAALAAGLYNHAHPLMLLGRTAQARDVLAESERHYAVLAAAEPERYTVYRWDVRLRTAVTHVLDGDHGAAAAIAREVLAAYPEAPADDPWERDLGVVRAHAVLGRALLLDGEPAAALTEFDAALFAGEGLRERAGITGADFSWLASAPPAFRGAAPEWLGAAVAAMELHDAAGRWGIAADAANIAMRLAGGLAAFGRGTAVARFEAVLERAREVWWSAEHPLRAAALRAGPFDEVLVGGSELLHGPRLEPDLARLVRLAGWEPAPTGGD